MRGSCLEHRGAKVKNMTEPQIFHYYLPMAICDCQYHRENYIVIPHEQKRKSHPNTFRTSSTIPRVIVTGIQIVGLLSYMLLVTA